MSAAPLGSQALYTKDEEEEEEEEEEDPAAVALEEEEERFQTCAPIPGNAHAFGV
jgi:hypothetical protein